MSDAPPDLVSRGRAIFERLRGGDTSPPEAATPDPDAPAESLQEEPSTDDERRAEVDGEAPEAVDAPAVSPEVAPSGEELPSDASTVAVAGPDDAGSVEDTAVEDGTDEPSPVIEGVHLEEQLVEQVDAAEARPDGAEQALPPSEPVPAPPPAPAPTSTFVRPLPRVIAVANQKGGVGKTTTAVNLGAGLAEYGYRTLVVDLDPQGNASTGLGINVRDLQASMYEVMLHDTPIDDCIEPTSVRNLFVAPASLDLAGAEIELVPAFSRELRLKRALDEVRDDYDFVLVDCPPSLGLLTVNSMAAASEVLVPIQCEYYALEGLGQLMRNVTLVQKNLNPALELSIIVLVMYDARTKLADQVAREVRDHFGAKVCRTVVPRTVRLSEAPSYGQSILSFDPTSRGAIAYRELAKEVSGGPSQRLG